jgi:hypothetical protein
MEKITFKNAFVCRPAKTQTTFVVNVCPLYVRWQVHIYKKSARNTSHLDTSIGT